MSKAQQSGGGIDSKSKGINDDYIAEYKVATRNGNKPQLNVTNPDAFYALGVKPGDRVGLRENGVGLILEPVDNGHKKRHTSSVYNITMNFSEFEARMLGNRLWQVAEFYAKKEDSHLESELKWWARRFHDECNTRSSQ